MEGIFNPKKAEPEITTTIVSRQLQTMQDLTTAKENDYGFEEFSEGNIAHVNKKKFTMFYSYEIRAGVDLAKAGIKVHDDTRTISITLPKATLQSVSVDPDSLRFFDSESSLFNGNEVTDTAEALKHAKNRRPTGLPRASFCRKLIGKPSKSWRKHIRQSPKRTATRSKSSLLVSSEHSRR